MDAMSVVLDALRQFDIPAEPIRCPDDERECLVIGPAAGAVQVELRYRSLVAVGDVERILTRPVRADVVVLVVADRITQEARRLVTARGAGYYDLRGRFVLRTATMVIDVQVQPVCERPDSAAALAGAAGREVAAHLLTRPGQGVAVRQLARELGRSPSTVSAVLAKLRRDEMVDDRNAVTGSALFWALADVWATRRTYLAQIPPPGRALHSVLRLGLDPEEDDIGWALTDSAAAVAYGAPLVVQSGDMLDFYVPDQSVVNRAVRLLGPAGSPAVARCAVRVAPVPSVCRERFVLDSNPHEWPTAHPLYVALDLAQDVGRGREVLEAWTPQEPWARVW